MAQLLPDGLVDPALDEPVPNDPIEYGESWVFHLGSDCACQDPVVPGPHLAVKGSRVMKTEGVETLEQWIRMALATDRYRWEIYDNQYGTEFTQLLESSAPEEEAETEITRLIREAILVDPRVASVTSVRIVNGRNLTPPVPATFVAEVRVVTYTGELKLLQLDSSITRNLDAYLDT